MRIREAVPADAESIRDVHYHSIVELGTEAYSQEQVDAWAQGCDSADYTAAIEADEVEFIVAEDDSAVVAFGSLKLAPADEYEADVDAEITGVYVHPSVARHGVGTHIYAELEQRARMHAVQMLGLSASLNAVSFYEAHGYERVREYSHEFSSHKSTGVTGMVVEMKKRL
jgi:putative acetyltransferase